MPVSILKYIVTNKYFIMISVTLISIISFYTYYTITKLRIENLTTKLIVVEKDNAEKTTYIENLKLDYDKILKLKDDLSKLNETSANRIADLRSRLNRESQQKKSIGQLAKQKPTLVEKFINKEIKKQIDCFKTITPDGDC